MNPIKEYSGVLKFSQEPKFMATPEEYLIPVDNRLYVRSAPQNQCIYFI